MKLKLISILIIFIPTLLFGQNYFYLNSKTNDSVLVEVNGVSYVISEEPVRVKTKSPVFDTLVFKIEGPNSSDKIICNFKIDSLYSIAGACCATLDVFPAYKLKNDSLKVWDYEEDFTKIQKLLMDKPYLSLKLKSEEKDVIYGWHADMSCLPRFKSLSEQKWGYGIPQKCYYWSNISSFIFFKSKESYELNESGVVVGVYPNFDEIEVLGEIQVRLFDNERFVIEFDPKTQEIKLEYE